MEKVQIMRIITEWHGFAAQHPQKYFWSYYKFQFCFREQELSRNTYVTPRCETSKILHNRKLELNIFQRLIDSASCFQNYFVINLCLYIMLWRSKVLRGETTNIFCNSPIICACFDSYILPYCLVHDHVIRKREIL